MQQKQSRVIKEVKVSDDGLSVQLTLDQFRMGFIYEIRAEGVRNTASNKLLNDYGYYTLNQVPNGSTIISKGTGNPAVATASSLRVTTQPADWDQPDVEIKMGTLPGLKFDQTEVSVKAGDKIKWTFNNNDDMLHNVIIVNPGKADEVGAAAQELGLDGETLSYVPESNEILAHTNLLHPDDVESIYFKAPQAPGRYEYVCTFPGHHVIMRGVLVVE
ncbi:MAG: plastocyanin/azurin family copper-binding protein [Bacteroidota bacterium]